MEEEQSRMQKMVDNLNASIKEHKVKMNLYTLNTKVTIMKTNEILGLMNNKCEKCNCESCPCDCGCDCCKN